MKLEVKNLTCSYLGNTVIEDLSFSVKEGEFVSILGPSGCGKSTLLNILAGVLEADHADILVDQAPVKGISKHFAYMPQQDLLMPWKNIIDNVCLSAQIDHKNKQIKQQALDNFETFGLKGYEDSYPKELSGGMRQRAAFLRTALCAADILLLDEPFGALDVITRADMQDWLRSIRTKLNRTTLLVTHDIDEAIFLSDRILVMTGKPACFTKEIKIEEQNRTREWLFDQAQLRSEIYHYLKEAMV